MPLRKLVACASVLFLIAGCSGFLVWLKLHQKLGKAGVKMELPETVLSYGSTNNPITKIEADMLPKDTTLVRRIYQKGNNGVTNEIMLTMVVMGTDRTSIHKPQYCLTGQGWQIKQTEFKTIAIQKPQPYSLEVNKLVADRTIQAGDGKTYSAKAIYLYWFVADGVLTAKHGDRIWHMMKHLVSTGELQRWAYVSCFAICAPGQEETTYAELERFVAASTPEFQIAAGKPLGLAQTN